jgi:hypothetical protein
MTSTGNPAPHAAGRVLKLFNCYAALNGGVSPMTIHLRRRPPPAGRRPPRLATSETGEEAVAFGGIVTG